MEKNENPIPISRGKELQIQKLIDALKEKLKNLVNLQTRLTELIKDKQVLYNRELMKPLEKQNLAMIADLSQEIETLNSQASEVFDMMLKTDDFLQAGEEKLRDIEELSELIKDMTSLESILAKKPEK